MSCQYEGCDKTTIYKDGFCIQHYVDAGESDSVDSAATTTTESSVESLSNATSTLSVESTTSTESTTTTSPSSVKSRFANFGGGGVPCTICTKTCYPAETVQFESKAYHVDCFSCITCKKKMEMYNAAQFEGCLYCRTCFAKQGLNRKQTEVKWSAEQATSTAHARRTSNFGGGGVPCSICTKTVYPAETVQFETKPYHSDCFNCSLCKKNMNLSDAGQFEGSLYCRVCFAKQGLNRKQANVEWKPKETTNALASKFGGGGNPCQKCNETVYAGETVQFEQKFYHPKCLSCSECNKELTVSECSQFDAKLFCKRCWEKGNYAQKQRETMGSTLGPISPSSPSSDDKPKYNARFANLGGGGFTCVKCSTTVYPAEVMQYEGRHYHPKCFSCEHCSKEILQLSAAEQKNDKVYCNKCFMELGLWQPNK